MASGMYHSCIGLGYLEERIRDLMAQGRRQEIFTLDDMPISNAAALTEIRRYASQGLRFLLACDNVDAQGHCAGHEKALV